MSPEIKILSYLGFVFGLFFIRDVTAYLLILIALSLFLCVLPFQSVKKGWVPISLFLLFTFVGNVTLPQGKIVFDIGPFTITDEGLQAASLRTGRVFFMIAGAKILTATTGTGSLVDGLGRILKPLERLGLPVREFFSTMGLAMRSIPRIKERISEAYGRSTDKGGARGFWNRTKVISVFLIPLFVHSIRNPEIFFEDRPAEKERDNSTGDV